MNLRHHAFGILNAAPLLGLISAVIAGVAWIILAAPLWTIVASAGTGLIYGFILPYYWRNPSYWKFGLMIGLFVSALSALRNKMAPGNFSPLALQFWAALSLFLGVSISMMCLYLLVRKTWIKELLAEYEK